MDNDPLFSPKDSSKGFLLGTSKKGTLIFADKDHSEDQSSFPQSSAALRRDVTNSLFFEILTNSQV